jgi:hypothetical protein
MAKGAMMKLPEENSEATCNNTKNTRNQEFRKISEATETSPKLKKRRQKKRALQNSVWLHGHLNLPL